MECKKCGCQKYYLCDAGTHIGAYCSACDKWIKWVSVTEVKTLKARGYTVFPKKEKASKSADLGVEVDLGVVLDVKNVEKVEKTENTCKVCKTGLLDTTAGKIVKIEGYSMNFYKEGKLEHSVYIKHCPSCGKDL